MKYNKDKDYYVEVDKGDNFLVDMRNAVDCGRLLTYFRKYLIGDKNSKKIKRDNK